MTEPTSTATIKTLQGVCFRRCRPRKVEQRPKLILACRPLLKFCILANTVKPTQPSWRSSHYFSLEELKDSQITETEMLQQLGKMRRSGENSTIASIHSLTSLIIFQQCLFLGKDLSESSTPQEHVTVGVTEAFGAFLNQHGNLYRDFPTCWNLPKRLWTSPERKISSSVIICFYQGFLGATYNEMANHTQMCYHTYKSPFRARKNPDQSVKSDCLLTSCLK